MFNNDTINFDEPLDDQVDVLRSMLKVVQEVIDSKDIDLDAEDYFMWMYNVMPFAEG